MREKSAKPQKEAAMVPQQPKRKATPAGHQDGVIREQRAETSRRSGRACVGHQFRWDDAGRIGGSRYLQDVLRSSRREAC